jgi:hypothetical protein
MKKSLIKEVKRIKELSSIKEDKKILNEGTLDTLISDITKLFEIASDELKNSDIFKKLNIFLKSLKIGDTSFVSSASSDSVPGNLKSMSSSDDEFYKEILTGIDAPWNDVNKLLLYSWRRAEGGICKNNPFNTKKILPGVKSESCNKEGVKHYLTKEEGITATIKTLEEGRVKYRYQEIIDALISSNPNEFFVALGKSPWGTNSDLAKGIYDDYISGVSKTNPTPIA